MHYPHYYHPTIDDYQANELVSCDYREQLDLRRFDDKINGALMFVFGEDLEHVHIGPGFYAYKLNGRLATRQEKARLGRLIVRRIPELIPAIKSYPLSVSAPRSAPVFRTIRSSHLTSSFLHRGFSYDYATT